MFIDTTNNQTMIESMCSAFNITSEDFTNIINTCIASYPNREDAAEHIMNYLYSHKGHPDINEVIIYHLSRRLNGSDNNCYNLHTLLLTDNVFSNFLRDNHLTFKDEGDRIRLYIDGVRHQIDESVGSERSCYVGAHLSYRLSKIRDDMDPCINGFLLNDRLKYNDYFRVLNRSPEFICNLSDYLDNDLKEQFFQKSQYYCMTYKLPTSAIIFDENENERLGISIEECIVYYVIIRIIENRNSNEYCILDTCNPIVRLSDETNLNEECFYNRYILDDYIKR